ncbi:hypothetical protein KFK09_014062 [Dendrobium nobile]|uniref:Uncharacterized protein n=1 Tax=Dendrobium nobile TaxID=94219 RepID=A0A8T3BAN3_DENNO|nr:hypothetical protein KFK09_014062 [Dendrobium nobile]
MKFAQLVENQKNLKKGARSSKSGGSYRTTNTLLAPKEPTSGNINETTMEKLVGGSGKNFKRLIEKEMQEKRVKGLCFLCDEKYTPGHRCRDQTLQVLTVCDDERIEEGGEREMDDKLHLDVVEEFDGLRDFSEEARERKKDGYLRNEQAPVFVVVTSDPTEERLVAGRATVARSDNPLPKHAEKPATAILRSTSSLSRGKVANFPGDAITRISSFGERRSFSGFRTFDTKLAAKAQLGKNPGVKSEKYVNLKRGVTYGCKSKRCLGEKPQRSSYEALKKVGRKAEEAYIGPSDSQNSVGKDFSGPNMEPVDTIGSNEVGV